jgi:protein O-mannosyl-transferase
MDLKINTKFQFLTGVVLVLALVAITFTGTLKNSFVDWDDYAYVVDNNLVRGQSEQSLKEIFTTPVSLNYHPLTILSLRMNNNDCKSCPEGISPRPFIGGNLILHLLNSLLVLVLIYLLTGKNIIASVVTAILFGIHPMHVESVAWIAARKDVLYSFFFLSGLVAWIQFRRADKWKYIWLFASFVLFVFSCLSKAMAVVFPLLILLIDFWNGFNREKPFITFFKRVFSVKELVIYIPFFIVSVFFGIMAFRLQNNESFLGMISMGKNETDVVNTVLPLTFFQRAEVAAYGIVMYLVKFIVPVNLSAFYPYPAIKEFMSGPFSVILLLSLIAALLLVVFAVWSARKTRLILFGTGFFIVTVFLVLQFVSVGNAIIADRYTYLPYIGLALIPGLLISESNRKLKTILLPVMGCFILVLMVLSKEQVRTWKNTETLWTNVLEKHPRTELATRARGKYYSKMSGRAKSEGEKKVLEDKAFEDFSAAIKAGTKSADVYEGTAIIYNSRKEPEKALLFINKALIMNPLKGGIYYNRAMIYDQLNARETAIDDYTKALELDPGLVLSVLSNRSVLYLETGKFKEAKGDLDKLITLEAGNYMLYFNRAFAKLQMGDKDGAIDDYKKVLQLNPGDEVTKKQLNILQETLPRN